MPRRRGFAFLGAVLLALGTGLLGYFSGHYFATGAVADEQCPQYIDLTKPFCRELQNRLNADLSFFVIGDSIMAARAIMLAVALAKERPKVATRPPDHSGASPPS